MFPYKFTCDYNEAEKTIMFFPERPVAAQINISCLLYAPPLTNRPESGLLLLTQQLEPSVNIFEIVKKFIQRDEDNYAPLTKIVKNDQTDPANPNYVAILSTQGVEITQEQFDQLTKDFFAAFFDIINVANSSKKSLNDCLNKVRGSEGVQYVSYKEKAFLDNRTQLKEAADDFVVKSPNL